MITKLPTTMTARKKIPNFKLKEIISDIVEQPATEWQCEKIISLVDVDGDNPFNFGYYSKDDIRLLRMYGMSLYCEACKKYDVKPTDCIGKPIPDIKVQKWLNRSHRLTYNYHYREEFLKPMMYKLNQL